MKTNPFTSSIFESIWSKHFNNVNDPIAFEFIKGVQFLKKSRLGVYENIGKNLTKGIYYDLDFSKNDFKGKTYLIYDVPTYFELAPFSPPSSSSLKLKKVFQYQGFLMDISSFSNQDDYINAQFSSKNRREFRSNQRRLEACFDISYTFIHDAIAQTEFDDLFKQFHDLLSKRFAGKQTNYHHLSADKWNYYKELVFNMLSQKRASLLVIYKEKIPIGITLNFHSEDVLFEAITVFDPDYYKFSIGKTSIIKLLEWCFENKYRISDFSKGDYDYKHKWSNLSYDFDYHILYDSKSILSVFKANYVALFYKAKLYLRRKKVNQLYRKYTFLIKGEATNFTDKSHDNFSFEKLENFVPSEDFERIDFKSQAHKFLLQFVYTFLFANPEYEEQIEVYKQNNKNVYVIKGSKKSQKISFS
ncbi:MAG: GNAT family N-acetyltransferase [Psychroserpens sp.]|uniref:GNAT family N-acetyltransferase n=1 Tax=Psychroserpens sp. TaxID=2020870 RepID=UPI003002C106